ncbi:hypothetical protein SPACI_036620 [Sporomusa acidovorans DSM 3132]|uniref:Filamentous hemagglutinin n=3 Tax=Sporomusa TaxID=2375 RepID=A0ABZ3J645_SPOA4
MDSDTKTSSSSAAIGASFGLSTGSFGGLTGSANSGKGKETQSATTNTESQLNASGTVKLKSGNDTNISGSQVKGKKVEVDAGDNLNIESRQDSDTYTAKNQSAGIGFGTGKISGTNGSISAGKTKSNYDSVTEQAGIFAGQDGFAIKVGKNTDLKGAVITSEATPDKNKLSTDTLTYSDIQNKAEYSSGSAGVGYAAGKDANGNDVAKKDQGLTPNIGTKVSGNADSTTKSAISPGTIEIRSNPNQNISNLSRNTTNTVNALGKIFDKKTVQEKQELAGLFGQEVFKAIGDLGLKEGSPEKTALDAFAGGLMAKLGGGSFAAGAAGAGLNQLLMNELANIKDPAVMQWASAIVGATAAKVVGGNAQTGASVAASETKNNVLSHDEFVQMKEELENCKNKDERSAVLKKWDALSQERDKIINQLYVESEQATSDEEREAIRSRQDQLYAAWGISDGIGETLVIGEKTDKYSFDWKSIWDGAKGLSRGILGLQGDDYYDRSNTYKYWYSVGNRATPLALSFEGLNNPFSSSTEFAIGYNGTLAQTTVVDAWKIWSTGSTIMNASTNNSNSEDSTKPTNENATIEQPNTNQYASTYQQRLNQTPTSGANGQWVGYRGESTYISTLRLKHY